jgi:hypothetical protein
MASVTPNDVVRVRGLWDVSADPAITASATAQSARFESAAAPPWPTAPDDGASAKLALAYAAPERTVPAPATHAAAMGGGLHLGEIAATLKREVLRRAEAATLPASHIMPKVIAAKPGERSDDPWLLAMIVAPNAQRYMSTSLSGTPDLTTLAPMINKPARSVMMTFGDDPYLGMTAARFSGTPVVFVSTVTFATSDTASLQ